MSTRNQQHRSPGCPRCGYELAGTMKAWTDRCPLQMPCSECGYQMNLSLVLGPQGPPRWFIGGGRGFFARFLRGPSTIIRMMVPFWPWRTLSLEMLQRACSPRSMVAWFLWLALAFSFLPISALVAHESTLIRQSIRWASKLMASNRIELQKARAKKIDLNGDYPFVDPEVKTVVPEVDSPWFVWTWVGRCSMARLGVFLGGPRPERGSLGFPRLRQKDQEGFRGDVPTTSVLRAGYVPVVMLDRIVLLRGIPGGSSRAWTPEGQWATRFSVGAPTRFLLIVPLVVGSTLLMPFCFLLLPLTLRRAGVDTWQLARLTSFSLAILLPIGALEIYLGSSSVYGPLMTTIRRLWYIDVPAAAILLSTFLLWAWWWGACRLLRLPRSPLVAAVLVLIANLGTAVALWPWMDTWFGFLLHTPTT